MVMMKRKILIVEDEASIAETIVYALQTEGFDVIWTALGTECLDIL